MWNGQEQSGKEGVCDRRLNTNEVTDLPGEEKAGTIRHSGCVWGAPEFPPAAGWAQLFMCKTFSLREAYINHLAAQHMGNKIALQSATLLYIILWP